MPNCARAALASASLINPFLAPSIVARIVGAVFCTTLANMSDTSALVPIPPPTEPPMIAPSMAFWAIDADIGRSGSISYNAPSMTACTPPSCRPSSINSRPAPSPILVTRLIKLSKNSAPAFVVLSPNNPRANSLPPSALSDTTDSTSPVTPALRATPVANSSASFSCASDKGIELTPVSSAIRAFRSSSCFILAL